MRQQDGPYLNLTLEDTHGRQSSDTNRVSEIRRILYRITMKLGRDNKVDGKGSEEYKKTIQQEKKESIRIEGQRQYMAGE